MFAEEDGASVQHPLTTGEGGRVVRKTVEGFRKAVLACSWPVLREF
jgi:hypothetical protein